MKTIDNSFLANPEIFMENRLPAHSDHIAYASVEEMNSGSTSYRYCLNGLWKFSYSSNNYGAVKGFEADDFCCDGWDEIPVPAHIQMEGYDKPHYTNTTYPWDGHEWIEPGQIPQDFNPVASLIRDFEVPDGWENMGVRISFQGVESGFALWINGEYVGYSEDSFDPSDFDISDYIRPGKNKLAVRVWKWTSSSWAEDQDFFRFSGIFRDVYLYAVPSLHIEDMWIKPELSEDFTTADIRVSLNVSGSGRIETVLYEAAMGQLRPDSYELARREMVFAGNNIIDDGKNALTIHVDKPSLWSAEKPYLYVLVVTARDGEGNITEVIAENVGIRRFEMKNGIMLLNGRRIVFKGVNRHEFSSTKGRVPVYADLLTDIETIKRNNINGIRTSHYPNCSKIYTDGVWQPGIYELCDVYGLYMIAENNMETHGSWEAFERGIVSKDFIVPGDNLMWEPMLLDRVDSCFNNNKNHSSILMWSLGNESFGGLVIYHMAQRFRQLDDTRLIHYEGIFHDRSYEDSSDMESQMYPSVDNIRKHLRENVDKPFICCEYSHAMGNSCGGMHLYTKLTDEEERYQGGFIWDYIDQSIYRKDRFGNEYLAYGGEFGDRPSDYEFSGNGIAYGGDRSESPKMQDVKYNYQNIWASIEDNSIVVENKNLFTDTSEYNCVVTILADGKERGRSELNISVAPLESVSTALPDDIQKLRDELLRAGCEVAINVSFVLMEDTLWATRGHEIAFAQKIYKKEWSSYHCCEPVVFINGNNNIGVKGNHFSAIFSKGAIGPVSYVYGGRELISYVPRPNFWRAPNSNDEGNMFSARYAQWKIASMYINTKSHERFEDSAPIVDKGDNSIRVTYNYKMPTTPASRCTVRYEVFGDGTIETTLSYDPVAELGDMPEFGMLFKLPADYDRVTYYGLGPKENYVDRLEGARLGIYEYSASDNMSKYLVPQECGNRCGVRFARITDRTGHGLVFTGDEMSLSVLPYTPHELENASYVYELPPVQSTVIRVSKAQMGIAGDDSWGAKTHPQYLIDVSQPLEFTFRFCGC